MNPIAQFLEDLLGLSQKGSKGNIKFVCPFPGCEGRPSRLAGEHKLEVDAEGIEEEGKTVYRWHCWSCNSRGKSLKTLLKSMNAPEHKFVELAELLKYSYKPTSVASESSKFIGSLPKEYKPLEGKLPRNELKLRHAKAYLKKRGYTEDDIVKYQIGYCEDGEYSGRIVIPSYDSSGRINYIVARTIYDDVKPKYKNPVSSRNIIPFEMFVNWEEPVILCEGAFDLMAIKRNVIPLFDKEMQEALVKKLLSSKCKKVYLALDPDAIKQFIKYAEMLINEGKQVFEVDFSNYAPSDEEKIDPSKIGFEEFTKLVQKAERITRSKLMKIKIQSL